MSEIITSAVRTKYGQVARSALTGDHDGVRSVAEAFGYTPEELNSIPAAANMGLSCGNPIASANLKPGEVVLDLGCGGGLDVFLAAQKVGPTGKVIGVDMTPEMIARARKNAATGGPAAVTNVEFHLATIDRLPIPDSSVDVVISNCVINLAADKDAVFREIFRVLKPGGRVAVSDIAIKKPLPPELATDIMAFVGCIAGAIPVSQFKTGLKQAGFAGVQVVDTHSDLNAYGKVDGQVACCAPPMTSKTLPLAGSSCCGGNSCEPESSDIHRGLNSMLQRYNVNEYAASVRVFALKPH